jgi:hypothetical protein
MPADHPHRHKTHRPTTSASHHHFQIPADWHITITATARPGIIIIINAIFTKLCQGGECQVSA